VRSFARAAGQAQGGHRRAHPAANAPDTLELLRDAEQPVDVSVYVWEPKADTWRLLTNREKALLWEFRQRRPARA
jgi:hypothetical protein